MDIVCIAIFVYYFIKGCFKGAVSMLFSLLGLFFVAFVAWQLANIVYPFVESFAGKAVFNTLTTFLNGAVPGTFSSVAQLQSALAQTKIGLIFSLFLSKLLPELVIDGNLSAGQILAPTLTAVFLEVLSFIVLFLLLSVVLKLLRLIIEKFIKKCGLSFGNRILGGVIGIAKGLLIFSLVFIILTITSNLLMNQWLLRFVQSGKLSHFIYQTFAQKIFGIFY